jgi:hypothetical protein
MPNGRSGGFRIPVAQIRKLLQGLPGESRVGNRGAKSVTVAELAQRVDRHREEDLPVEEQDHKWYIVHFGAEPKGWIVIGEDSPLYVGLRSRHAEWLRMSSKGQ